MEIGVAPTSRAPMSATKNSGRLRIMSTTRSPRPTPSPWRPAATRQASSAYSAKVVSCQPSPSRARSATASGRARTVSRKRPGTVCPRTCSASISFVTCSTGAPLVLCLAGHHMYRTGARRAQAKFSTGQGGKPVENGGYWQPFVPRRSLGRPARGFSTQPPRGELFPGPEPLSSDRLVATVARAAQRDGDVPAPVSWVADARRPRRGATGELEALREAPLRERAERVVVVQPGEHHPGLLAPRHRRRRPRPPNDLRVAALVDAVLGPRARIVLRARDLDEGHVAGGREAAHPVAVPVTREVPADVLAPPA